jgi:predicted permease
VSNVGMTETLLRDLRSAWAGLVAGRWSSVASAGTLALGVGACLTGALLAYGGLLRALPVPDERNLVVLTQIYRAAGIRDGVRLPQYPEWRDRLAGTVALAAAARERATVRVAGREPIEAQVAYVTDEWFGVVGVAPTSGQALDARSPTVAAVVSQTFARQVDGAFTMGGRPFEVVGVMPPAFAAVDDRDVWVLARAAAPFAITGGADARNYQMVGRLAPGATVERALAAASAVQADLTLESQRGNRHMEVRPLRDEILGDTRGTLLALAVAAGLILAVACANVGMTLVNRALARQREFSVRLALGAERGALVRTAVAEVALLAVVGTAAGAWLASAATSLLQETPAAGLPAAATHELAGPLVMGGVALCLVVILACALAPLMAIRQMDLAATLRPREAVGSRAGSRLRAVLAATQLATAVVLVTGAVLLGRTMVALSHADIGLDAPDAVATVPVAIGESLESPPSRLAVMRRLVDEARQLPGVVAAGLGAALPPSVTGLVFTIRVTSDTTDATRAFDLVPSTPGYLEAMGARLVTGRMLTAADEGGPPVAVMSESAVRHLAMVIDTALGQGLNLPLPTAAGPRVKPRIVGVVRDMRFAGLDAAARGAIFVPWTQLPMGRAHLVLRVAGDAAVTLPAVSRLVRETDPTIPPGRARTLAAVIAESLAERSARFSTALAFAVVGTVLAALALVGAMVRSVVERRRELAVRAAVGASPAALLTATLLRGLRLAGAGIVIGVAASVGFARLAESMLWGVSPTDPTTYVVTAAGAFVLAAAACYVPARRAAAADPVVLLSSE